MEIRDPAAVHTAACRVLPWGTLDADIRASWVASCEVAPEAIHGSRLDRGIRPSKVLAPPCPVGCEDPMPEGLQSDVNWGLEMKG